MWRSTFTVAMLVAASVLNVSRSAANEWPTRTVTMVVPFAAGSGTDILGRILAARLSEILGQQVIIENMGGAGGMIGTARVAKASPDGYQFVLGNIGTHAQNQTLYKRPSYDAIKDFEPVGLVADLPPVLVIRKDLPADTLQEFAAYARKNKNKLQYGSAGAGSAAQLGCSLLNSDLKLAVTHVAYRGAALAMQDLIAGRIDYQCALLPAPLSQIETKQVKALAILTRDRSPILPDLATADEQGVKGFDASAWHAVFMPKGTPPDIIQKMNKALAATLDTPEIKQKLAQLGATVVPQERRSPEYLKGFVMQEIEKWAKAIKAANLQLD